MKKLIAALMMCISCIANAWEPTKPVNVLIGFRPGSGNELSFRAISAIVQRDNPNVNFTIELKPGADSVIASNALMEAKPDGHTISIPSYMGTFVTNDLWQKELKKFQYNSFTNVTSIGKSPLVFVANAKSEVNTINELTALVKNPARPINFAGGSGAHRMAYEFFVHEAGAKREMLRYAVHQGPLQAVTSVAGDTDMEFGVMPIAVAWPLIQAGKVKILGITGNRTLEQVPTAKPIRVNGKFINIYAAWSIVLPPNTPAEIVKWYQEVFTKAIKSPEMARFRQENLIFIDERELTPQGLSAAIQDLRNVWIPFSQQVNLME